MMVRCCRKLLVGDWIAACSKVSITSSATGSSLNALIDR